MEDQDRPLKVGGTCYAGRDLYITREDLEESLYEALLAGEYCNLLSSRQVGKSSVMSRVALRLQDQAYRIVVIDLAGDLGSPATADSWYAGFLGYIAHRLDLSVDVAEWYESHSAATPNQRLIDFFRCEVLRESDQPLVLFVDEIDHTLGLKYTDDFFTAVRSMSNQRGLEPAFEKITFCMVGVASPNELVKERRTTPYNVGRDFEIRDFDLAKDDLSPLARAMCADPAKGHVLLETVFEWADGHPYLTAWLCDQIIRSKMTTRAEVAEFAKATFCSLEWISERTHFDTIAGFLNCRVVDPVATLRLYEKILRHGKIRDDSTRVCIELKLSGIVKRGRDGALYVRNRIYQRLFDRAWVKGSQPQRSFARMRQFAIYAALVAFMAGISFAYVRLVKIPRDERVADLVSTLDQEEATDQARSLFEQILPLHGQRATNAYERFLIRDLKKRIESATELPAAETLARQLRGESVIGGYGALSKGDENGAVAALAAFRETMNLERGERLWTELNAEDDMASASAIADVLLGKSPDAVSGLTITGYISRVETYLANVRARVDELIAFLRQADSIEEAERYHRYLTGEDIDPEVRLKLTGYQLVADELLNRFWEQVENEKMGELLEEFNQTSDLERGKTLLAMFDGSEDVPGLGRRVVRFAEEGQRAFEALEQRIIRRSQSDRAQVLLATLENTLSESTAQTVFNVLSGKVIDSETGQRIVGYEDAAQKAYDEFNNRRSQSALQGKLNALKQTNDETEARDQYRDLTSSSIRGQSDTAHWADAAERAMREFWIRRATSLSARARIRMENGQFDDALVLSSAAASRRGHSLPSELTVVWEQFKEKGYSRLHRTLRKLRGASMRYGLSFSPDSEQLAVTGTPGLYHLESGVTRKFRIHLGDVALAFSPDGKYLVDANYEGTVYLRDLTLADSYEAIGSHGRGSRDVFDLDISPGNEYVALALQDTSLSGRGPKSYTAIWDIDRREVVKRIPSNLPVHAVQFSPDGTVVAIGREGGIELHRVGGAWERIHTVKLGTRLVLDLDFTLDGSEFVPATSKRPGFNATGTHIWRLQHRDSNRVSVRKGRFIDAEDEMLGIAFARLHGRENGYVFAGGRGLPQSHSYARMWSIELDAVNFEILGHTDWVMAVDCSPNGRWVATASLDRTARVWRSDLLPDRELQKEVALKTGNEIFEHIQKALNLTLTKDDEVTDLGGFDNLNYGPTWLE